MHARSHAMVSYCIFITLVFRNCYSLCHKHIFAFQWSSGLMAGISCLLPGTDQQHGMVLNKYCCYHVVHVVLQNMYICIYSF